MTETNGLIEARELLRTVTDLHPPSDGMRHNLTVNNDDKLELNLMLDEGYKSIIIDDCKIKEASSILAALQWIRCVRGK